MRVLHVNFSDAQGGAARGAVALHEALRQEGVDSRFMAEQHLADLPGAAPRHPLVGKLMVHAKVRLDRLPLKLYPNRDRRSVFSVNWLPSRIAAAIRAERPNVVNLHWVGHSMIRPEVFRDLGAPIVWTLRDAWPFTGGCHVVGDCTRYRQQCGKCPQLGSTRERDLSRRIWLRKQAGYANVDLTAVGISRWIADCARQSGLLGGVRTEVIPNGVDTARFCPTDQREARAKLGLPADETLLLFGAYNATADFNKGFDLLTAALRQMKDFAPFGPLRLVVFGNVGPAPTDLPVPTSFQGVIHDDARLALLNAAADAVVVPSRQESFGKTATEALACGRPVVCFDTSGLKDIVDHQENGYRARCYEPDDLAAGLKFVLRDRGQWERLCEGALRKVDSQFSLGRIAGAYLELYESLREG